MRKHEEKYVKVLIYVPETLHSVAKKWIKQKKWKEINNFSELVIFAIADKGLLYDWQKARNKGKNK